MQTDMLSENPTTGDGFKIPPIERSLRALSVATILGYLGPFTLSLLVNLGWSLTNDTLTFQRLTIYCAFLLVVPLLLYISSVGTSAKRTFLGKIMIKKDKLSLPGIVICLVFGYCNVWIIQQYVSITGGTTASYFTFLFPGFIAVTLTVTENPLYALFMFAACCYTAGTTLWIDDSTQAYFEKVIHSTDFTVIYFFALLYTMTIALTANLLRNRDLVKLKGLLNGN